MLSILRFIYFCCFYSFIIVALIAPFTFQKTDFIALSPEVKLTDNKVVKQVLKPASKTEQALHHIMLPNFSKILDVNKKKQLFFNYLAPVVQQGNHLIAKERMLLARITHYFQLNNALSSTLQKHQIILVKKYRINKNLSTQEQLTELLSRIDEIPQSLVLVQAAIESAWGTSRFARIGLNFFGIWCYREGCGMVPNGRNKNAKHEVQAFKTVDAAVNRYLNNINTNNAYRVFRTIRSQLRAQQQPLSAKILATGLLPYSERGSDYVIELTNMIRHNQSYLQQSMLLTNAD